MSTRVQWPPSGFDNLPADEKVDDVPSLWDRMATSDSYVPTPDWHREIIRQRLADPDPHPQDWNDVRDAIKRDLRRRSKPPA